MKNSRPALYAAVALTIIVGCGRSSPEPSAPSAPAAGAPVPPAASPPKPWRTMEREERLAWMKKVVGPRMGAAFRAVDPVAFKDFSCATCHGPGAKQGKFDMPNPRLPKLDATDDFKAHKSKTPVMLDFMMKTVEPEMATLLGMPPYDPATHKGFGCGNCHLFKE